MSFDSGFWAAELMGIPELSTGHFSWTRPDPTRRNVDPSRPGDTWTRPDPTRPAIADKKSNTTRHPICTISHSSCQMGTL